MIGETWYLVLPQQLVFTSLYSFVGSEECVWWDVMHNREIRSRSLMNCPPQDTGVALLQSGNDKQILYQHHIHIQKFKIKNRTRSFQFSRQLSFCLLYHHQATTRQDPMKQGGCCSHVRLCLVRVWGTWEGVLGLGGGRGYLAMPRNRCSVASLWAADTG